MFIKLNSLLWFKKTKQKRIENVLVIQVTRSIENISQHRLKKTVGQIHYKPKYY